MYFTNFRRKNNEKRIFFKKKGKFSIKNLKIVTSNLRF